MIAGLLADLKRRDLLKDTLILWGGEFGRTPYSDSGGGRDHNHKGYTMWMHIHDWHATILHLLGLDHEQLTYRYAGREMRLTDVAGTVATDLLA